jgi:hypothetical protein
MVKASIAEPYELRSGSKLPFLNLRPAAKPPSMKTFASAVVLLALIAASGAHCRSTLHIPALSLPKQKVRRLLIACARRSK